MTTKLNYLVAVLVAAALAGCASTRTAPAELVEARAAVEALQNEPLARKFDESASEARAELATAERLFDDGAKLEHVAHHAYLATQLSALVETQAARQRAEDEIDEADERRQALLLSARERDAELARQDARQSQAAAAMANARADQQAAIADAARRAAIEAQQQAELLAAELENLNAERTEEGLMLTLTDVLFDTGKSELKPGAYETIDEIAEFLNNNGDRDITIKGHTDSRGNDDYNRQLSDARANSVRNALVQRGVDATRIVAEGMGEQYPVATNDTAAGRQQNRRVEIVISDS